MIDGLLEAYKNIAGCFISVDVLVSSLLPGLEFLENDIKELDPDKTVSRHLLFCFSTVSYIFCTLTGGNSQVNVQL